MLRTYLPLDFKFGMHVVKELFYFMGPADYTYQTYLWILLTRSELDPFLYTYSLYPKRA